MPLAEQVDARRLLVVFDNRMSIAVRQFAIKLIVGLAKVLDFRQVEGDTRKLRPLTARMNDMLRVRAVLRKIGRTDAPFAALRRVSR